MSIYSGFGTRALESTYMQTLNEINKLMAARLMLLMQSTTASNEDEDSAKFCRYFINLFKKLYNMDKIKRLEPQYSVDLSSFAMYIMTNKDELLLKGNRSSDKG